MSEHNPCRMKTIAYLIAAMGVMPGFALAETIETKTVEVVSTTPLPGVGLPLEQIPANIQVIKGEEIQNQQSLTIADFMSQNLVGVNVNETQNNPFQPNVNFRGFTASPLLGTPQGLSVFFDGVRINEPFGDVVNWDLIPMNAIANMSMIPGSNPLFGLNTLGGAISMQTKSGRTHQGGAIEASAGSWDRKAGQFEYGGITGNGVDYFIAGNLFDEDGWRDASPSKVKQLFGKLGWQNETTDFGLSISVADNDMIGNGLQAKSLIEGLDWESIYTKPDQTENKMFFANLNGSHWLSEKTMFAGNVYYRSARTKTLNGDGNDEYPDEFSDAIDVGGACDADGDNTVNTPGEIACATAALAGETGVINRTKSNRRSYGMAGQVTFSHDLASHENQFTVGAAYDNGRTTFKQTEEFGELEADRGILGDGTVLDVHKLVGKTSTWSVFATDTFSITDITHLTLSGRYNHSHVKNKDKLNPGVANNLDADYTYHRFNPSIGLSVAPNQAISFYGNYNEGSRTPTAIELGCADQANPCKLPNAMASDPYLKQVVSRTFEGGARGKLGKEFNWSASIYRTTNNDDIQFIAANPAGEGYFDNVGKTRRQGLDLGLNGRFSNFSWFAGYSYVKATYESSFTVVNEANSSSNDVDCDGNAVEGGTCVNSGDNIPGIPRHQFKLRGEWQALPQWTIGTNIVAFSDQYAHGNENNEHDGAGAKIGGYTIVNLDTRYRFGNSGWQVFAKVNNAFDREYYSGGMLGENAFGNNGVFVANPDDWTTEPFLAPGAPRAGWIGIRYEFGGKKSTPGFDND